MNNNQLSISAIIMAVAVFFSGYKLYQILSISDERQVIETDKAILGSVKYGLFSVQEWKDKVSFVLNKKIDEFELNDDNTGEIQQKLEQMLYFALDEVQKIMNERANESMFGALQSVVASFAIDVNDLRMRVPDFARNAMVQLGDDNTILDLKQFLKRKLSEYLERTVGKGDRQIFDETLDKYNCKEKQAADCIQELEATVKTLEKDIWRKSIHLILSVSLIFLLIAVGKPNNEYEYYLAIVGCLILLAAGVLTPMIDLDARIKQVKFFLMGEPVLFNEQMLFYQSKSIIDVFLVLLKSGQVESMIISVLILLFSVIFPVLKLFYSFVYIKNTETSKNKMIEFFVFKSGKWSMADVVVVAIFMSFIGFRGVINTQLAKLSSLNSSIEVITTNETQLQAGFMTFTVFCLGSIFLSSLLPKITQRQQAKTQNNAFAYATQTQPAKPTQGGTA